MRSRETQAGNTGKGSVPSLSDAAGSESWAGAAILSLQRAMGMKPEQKRPAEGGDRKSTHGGREESLLSSKSNFTLGKPLLISRCFTYKIQS